MMDQFQVWYASGAYWLVLVCDDPLPGSGHVLRKMP